MEKRKRVFTPEEKERARVRAKAYYEAHKDEVLAAERAKRAAARGVDTPAKQKQRARYYANREQIRAKAKQDRIQRRDEINAQTRLRRAQNAVAVSAREKTRRYRVQAQGLCITCCQPRIPGSKTYCEKHWFMASARKLGLRGPEGGEKLKALLVAQNYTCPYSGNALTPGVNASLDHRLPKSRYPELAFDFSNIQWVDHTVNLMKLHQTEAEFLTLCRLIVSHTHERTTR